MRCNVMRCDVMRCDVMRHGSMSDLPIGLRDQRSDRVNILTRHHTKGLVQNRHRHSVTIAKTAKQTRNSARYGVRHEVDHLSNIIRIFSPELVGQLEQALWTEKGGLTLD